MDSKEFQTVDEELMGHCDDVLLNRAMDYATADRLHNFKLAGKLQGRNPEDALVGMMAKHVIALHDAIDLEKMRTRDWWKEKIGDNINYLRLLWGLICEDNSEYVDKKKGKAKKKA
jgi:hypothetical protein